MKTRPVRLPPCAAGASPTTSSRARGSPKPGTGRPQYSSSWKRFTFVRATSRHQRRSRGQRSQCTTSRPTRARLSGMGEAQPSVPVAFCGESAAFASAAAAPLAARLALSASMRSMICARGASGAAVISWPSTFLWIASW